jgi:hypothetical protein
LPGLATKVCSPLTVPRDDGDVEGTDVPGWGTVVTEGKFAIATGDAGVYLEKCGSHYRQRLTSFAGLNPPTFCGHPGCPPAANTHAVVWQPAAGQIAGVLLPSLQHFIIHVPARIDPNGPVTPQGMLLDDQYSLWLTSKTLYLYLTGGGGVWTVSSPRFGS